MCKQLDRTKRWDCFSVIKFLFLFLFWCSDPPLLILDNTFIWHKALLFFMITMTIFIGNIANSTITVQCTQTDQGCALIWKEDIKSTQWYITTLYWLCTLRKKWYDGCIDVMVSWHRNYPDIGQKNGRNRISITTCLGDIRVVSRSGAPMT